MNISSLPSYRPRLAWAGLLGIVDGNHWLRRASSASSLLCSAGTTVKKAGNGAFQTLYNCTIPANEVALGQALRITTAVSTSGTTQTITGMYLNGVGILDEPGPSSGGTFSAYMDVTIMNTGSTLGRAVGVEPNAGVYTYGGVIGFGEPVTGLSWTSDQTLAVEFYGNSSGYAMGQLITIEVVD